MATTTPSGWDIHQHDPQGRERAYEWEHVPIEEWRNATWHAYIGVSLDADATGPIFATTKLEEPVRRGGCLHQCPGTREQGGMYDFLDITIDPITGTVWSAFVDVCTGACAEPGADAESPTRSEGRVAKQVAGTRLLEKPLGAARV